MDLENSINTLDDVNQERRNLSGLIKNRSAQIVSAVVLDIQYSDENDSRRNIKGSAVRASYGSPTATVYQPASKITISGVRIMQHGSAIRNMSIWIPTVSTHRMSERGEVLVPKIEDGKIIEPLIFVAPASVNDFDGDHVLIQQVSIGGPSFASVIIGTLPKATPHPERMHLDAISRDVNLIQGYVADYEPSGDAGVKAQIMDVRTNNLAGEPFIHPKQVISNTASVPHKPSTTSLADHLAALSAPARNPDRYRSSPVGNERYLSHNGTILRVDQQGNVIIDTSEAGIQNNELDPVPAARSGNSGHIDVNICRRLNQGLNIRIGGSIVFSISNTPAGVTVSIGDEYNEAFGAVLGERLATLFDSHQHMTNSGVTTNPIPIQLPAGAVEYPATPPGAATPSNFASASLSSSTEVIESGIVLNRRKGS